MRLAAAMAKAPMAKPLRRRAPPKTVAAPAEPAPKVRAVEVVVPAAAVVVTVAGMKKRAEADSRAVATKAKERLVFMFIMLL